MECYELFLSYPGKTWTDVKRVIDSNPKGTQKARRGIQEAARR